MRQCRQWSAFYSTATILSFCTHQGERDRETDRHTRQLQRKKYQIQPSQTRGTKLSPGVWQNSFVFPSKSQSYVLRNRCQVKSLTDNTVKWNCQKLSSMIITSWATAAILDLWSALSGKVSKIVCETHNPVCHMLIIANVLSISSHITQRTDTHQHEQPTGVRFPSLWWM